MSPDIPMKPDRETHELYLKAVDRYLKDCLSAFSGYPTLTIRLPLRYPLAFASGIIISFSKAKQRFSMVKSRERLDKDIALTYSTDSIMFHGIDFGAPRCLKYIALLLICFSSVFNLSARAQSCAAPALWRSAS